MLKASGAGSLVGSVKPMAMRGRSWKFSAGGGALFLLFLLGPTVVALISSLATSRPSNWLNAAVALTLLALFALLLWFLSLRPILKHGYWKLPRSWYEASFVLCAVYLSCAAFIFVTGHTPTKFGSHPIQREAGFIWLRRALFPLVVGVASYAYEKRKSA
jgi:hypothetical protein